MHLFISAGDVSGDIHAGRLARCLLERHPGWKISALGGSALQEAGATLSAATGGFGVIGIASALQMLPRALRARRAALKFLDRHPVQGAVLCDWGAFNVRLLPELRRRHIPVLYYFPPASWVREGPAGLGLVPLVDAVATPFPWSAERLRAAGAHAAWVGHPLVEQSYGDRNTLRRQWIRDDELLLALLPGSRGHELKNIAPHLAAACSYLRQHRPCRVVAAVPAGAAPLARACLADDTITVVEGQAGPLLAACDVAVVKSGTATLEAAVHGAHQVVVYDAPPLIRLQWHLMQWRRPIPFVAMPNIILQREAVPELLGKKCRGPIIAACVEYILDTPEYRDSMLSAYSEVRRALGAELPRSATAATADMVEELLQRTPLPGAGNPKYPSSPRQVSQL